MSDYNLKLTVRNNRILQAIKDAGFESVSAFAKANFIRDSFVNALICFRRRPVLEDGTLCAHAQQLCEILNLLPEDSWTFDQMGLKMGRCSFETVVEENALKALSDKHLVHLLLERAPLTDREKNVLESRFLEDQPLEEVAQKYDVSRERIRQIEFKALRKIREEIGDPHDPVIIKSSAERIASKSVHHPDRPKYEY